MCTAVPNDNILLTKAMEIDANGCYVLDAVNFDLFWAMKGMQTTPTRVGLTIKWGSPNGMRRHLTGLFGLCDTERGFLQLCKHFIVIRCT